MGNITPVGFKVVNVLEIEMVRQRIWFGRCGLCETIDIPMENELFCKYCYKFYFC